MDFACCSTSATHSRRLTDEEKQEKLYLRLQFWSSGACLFLILFDWLANRWLSVSYPPFAGVTMAGAYVAGGIFPIRGIWEDLQQWKFNVNFLMVLAAVGAAAIGEAREGAILMFLFSLSGALESFASGQTRGAIRSLIKLSPKQASRLRGEKEELVPVENLELGDILRVRPGESFAVDGVIIEGVTSVDQSAITGESMPVDRGPGNRVMAGTMNRFGVVKITMDRPLTETSLAKIFKIVEEAQQERAPTQRLIEKYGGPYTYFVLAMTLLSLLGFHFLKGEDGATSLYRAMTLMVVASPCALVLSIPSAVLAAIASGARRGILFKGGRAVETIGQTRLVAFDKTGTLTQGKPRLTEARYAKGLDPDHVLGEVAAVEQHSEHPLAKVMVEEAQKRSIRLPHVSESRTVPGMGMEGNIDGKRLRIGSEAFVCIHGGMESWMKETITKYRSRGLTCLVASKQHPLAVFGVADALRPGAIEAIHRLKCMGIHTVMLTGDHKASAEEFCRQLQLDECRASLLPDQKVEIIRELTAQYHHVAMVGDGINDAPALVSAQVGIAMGGSGTDAAMENADIVLMSDEIQRIPEVLDLGKRTRNIIHQNLVFALAVIFGLVTTSLTTHLNLAFGVIGHEGSTLLVVFNSLRLLRFRSSSDRC